LTFSVSSSGSATADQYCQHFRKWLM
jgi:hypothetical protein